MAIPAHETTSQLSSATSLGSFMHLLLAAGQPSGSVSGEGWLLSGVPQFSSMCSLIFQQLPTSSGIFISQLLRSKRKGGRLQGSELACLYFQNILLIEVSLKSSPDSSDEKIDATSRWKVLQSLTAKRCWRRDGKLWPFLQAMTWVMKRIKRSNEIRKWWGENLLYIKSEKTPLNRQYLGWDLSDKKEQPCFKDSVDKHDKQHEQHVQRPWAGKTLTWVQDSERSSVWLD